MEYSKIEPKLTLEYITTEKENQYFDRKSAKIDEKDLAKFVASFANANGGTIVLGVSDSGIIEGFENYPEKYNSFLKVTSNYLKLMPIHENETIEVVNEKGNTDKLLFIHISPSSNRIIRTVKDEVYLRQGDSSNKLSSDQIKLLEYDRKEVSFEDEVNLRSTIEDIDVDMLAIYQTALNTNKDGLEILRARKFLININGTEHLTNAGVLLFSKDPSVFFPGARVRIIKIEGNELQTGQNMNVVKDKTYALPLFDLIDESKKFIETQLREFNHLDKDGKFIIVPEYPEFAWVEGLTNAVIHRNYALDGEHIKIFIYDDRMEITSPGKLPALITIANMRKERYSRNPQISRVLTELGMVRELNEGVKRIYNEMKELFLDDPEYSEPNMSQVKLTLKNNVIMRSKRKTETMLKDSDLNNKWDKLNELQKQIIQAIHDRGRVTTNELVELLSEERRKIIRTLKKLNEIGLIIWVGSSIKDPTKYYKMK